MTEESLVWVPCPSRFHPGHCPHTQGSRKFLRFLTQARWGAEVESLTPHCPELGTMNFLPFLTPCSLLLGIPLSFYSFPAFLNLHFLHFSGLSTPSLRNHVPRTSLVAQWLRIRLPRQGTEVRALVREDPTCRGATKPVHHNYRACALEPASRNYWARVLQLLKPTHLEPVLCNKRSHCNEKPVHQNEE